MAIESKQTFSKNNNTGNASTLSPGTNIDNDRRKINNSWKKAFVRNNSVLKLQAYIKGSTCKAQRGRIPAIVYFSTVIVYICSRAEIRASASISWAAYGMSNYSPDDRFERSVKHCVANFNHDIL